MGKAEVTTRHRSHSRWILIGGIIGMTVFCGVILAGLWRFYQTAGQSYSSVEILQDKLEYYYEANGRYPASLKELSGISVNPEINYVTVNTRGSTANHYGTAGVTTGNEGLVCGYVLYDRSTENFNLDPHTKLASKGHCR